ncbi:RxLR effector candidate protein [Plasmodiophora brassicae]|uniref:RxLR effector candidate protein n=1 Tax=Plasmodiophora brassicae TaxID=37360 RepID=A0A0G4IRU7_PLABS|nr:hypothetical protein PBRA_005935 [Plasmodiophora brassicae]SPQ98369.1 unnamed protein product [Plasmodiophora brassicae]
MSKQVLLVAVAMLAALGTSQPPVDVLAQFRSNTPPMLSRSPSPDDVPPVALPPSNPLQMLGPTDGPQDPAARLRMLDPDAGNLGPPQTRLQTVDPDAGNLGPRRGPAAGLQGPGQRPTGRTGRTTSRQTNDPKPNNPSSDLDTLLAEDTRDPVQTTPSNSKPLSMAVDKAPSSASPTPASSTKAESATVAPDESEERQEGRRRIFILMLVCACLILLLLTIAVIKFIYDSR